MNKQTSKQINKYCVSGKKKSQESKNKANKTEDVQLKTSEPDPSPANMRDSAEGKLGVGPVGCGRVCPPAALTLYLPAVPFSESSKNCKGLNSKKAAYV